MIFLYILLTSWLPHCREFLNLLKEETNKQKNPSNFKAISEDSKIHEVEKNLVFFVKSGSLKLRVVGEGKLACDSGA